MVEMSSDVKSTSLVESFFSIYFLMARRDVLYTSLNHKKIDAFLVFKFVAALAALVLFLTATILGGQTDNVRNNLTWNVPAIDTPKTCTVSVGKSVKLLSTFSHEGGKVSEFDAEFSSSKNKKLGISRGTSAAIALVVLYAALFVLRIMVYLFFVKKNKNLVPAIEFLGFLLFVGIAVCWGIAVLGFYHTHVELDILGSTRVSCNDVADDRQTEFGPNFKGSGQYLVPIILLCVGIMAEVCAEWRGKSQQSTHV